MAADRAAEATVRSIGEQLRHLREDAGLPRTVVAAAAGIDPTYLGYIEAGKREPSVAILTRVAAALGADVSLRVYPTTGPPIRDRIQSRMVESLLRMLPPTWDRHIEVPVSRPVRGVIDLVIAHRLTGRVVTIEAHSDLRRLEQQFRWAAEKSDALPSSSLWPELSSAGHVEVSRIMLLRSTAKTRDLARSFAASFGAAYPADPRDLLRALLDPSRAWPGSGVIWVRVEGRETSVIHGRPLAARPNADSKSAFPRPTANSRLESR